MSATPVRERKIVYCDDIESRIFSYRESGTEGGKRCNFSFVSTLPRGQVNGLCESPDERYISHFI